MLRTPVPKLTRRVERLVRPRRAAVIAGIAMLLGASCNRSADAPRAGSLTSASATAARSASVSVSASASERNEQATFQDYATRTERAKREERLEALVLATPEWHARAAEVARGRAPLETDRPVLGLSCDPDFEPLGCKLDDPGCRLRCDAIRLCNGCGGGRWLTLELGSARQTVHLSDEDPTSPTYTQELPYGQWRNRIRRAARKERGPEYRALADVRQSFPDHHTGQGDFGYGKPAKVSAVPPPGVGAVLERGGFTFVRVEHYGAHQFPVFVVTGKSALPEARFRAWGAELVRAAGNRACEVARSAADRHQFDRFAAERKVGGVYVFIDDGFHPWLATDE